MFRVIIGAPAASASAAMTRAALVLAVRPMTRPPAFGAQIRANAAMTWVLPVPAGATRQLMSRVEVSKPRQASRWEGSRSVPASAAAAAAGVTRCRTGSRATSTRCFSWSRCSLVTNRASHGGR